MKYIRVILAVKEENMYDFRNGALPIFIEETDEICGAYVSDAYNSRDEAISGEFIQE